MNVANLLVLMQNPEVESFLQNLYVDKDGVRPESKRLDIDPPRNFEDFLRRVKVDSEFKAGNQREIYQLFEDMDLDEDPLLAPAYVLAYNSRKVTSLYCILAGTLDSKEAFTMISGELGEKVNDFFLDRNLALDWSKDRGILILTSKGKSFEIKVQKGEFKDAFVDQKVEQKLATPEEREVFSKHFSGEVELVDNALGEISDLTLIATHLSRSILVSIISRFQGKKINIVSKPKAEAASYEAEFIEFLERAGICDAKNRINFVYASEAEHVWARDYFLQAKDPRSGHRIFLESPNEHEMWQRNVGMSKAIASDDDTLGTPEYREFNLYFEGGDMRAVGAQLFMGEESFRKAVDQVKRPVKFRITVSPPVSLGIKEFTVEGNNRRILEKDIKVRLAEKLSQLKGDTSDLEFDEYLWKIVEDSKVETFFQIGGGEIVTKLPPDEEITGILKSEYEKYFGRELVVVGEGDEEEQAIFHIDMFVNFLPNPKGKPTVVIADTKETLKILSKLGPEELDSLEKSMVQSQMGASDLENDNFTKEDEIKRNVLLLNDIKGGMHDYVDELRSGKRLQGLQKRLDAISKWFQNKGYEVVRIPTAITHGNSRGDLLTLGKKNHEESSELPRSSEDADRTYSNSIVETYVDQDGILQKIIYMPTFGISVVEKRIVEIYNKLGYKVVPVDSLIEVARTQGVLNCITSEFRK